MAPFVRQTDNQIAPLRKPGDVMEVAGVRFTHPDRVLYPEQGVTKLGLAEYYQEVAEWALPHIVERPLSLVRCPDGQGKQCFYQKHVAAGVPDVLGRVAVEEKRKVGQYLVVKDAAGLVALVQMSVLEIHPWGAWRLAERRLWVRR